MKDLDLVGDDIAEDIPKGTLEYCLLEPFLTLTDLFGLNLNLATPQKSFVKKNVMPNDFTEPMCASIPPCP